MGGGMVGFHALSHSALGHKLGVNSRLIGLVTAAVCGLALVAGASVLSLFPRFVVGGLLMFLGLSFLIEWVYEAWFKLPKVDYFIIIMILVVIAFAGFLQGVALGLVATVFLFVLNYSRTNVVKHALSGTHFSSRVSREVNQQQILQEKGEEIYILQLQGFIFFGTANTLLGRVRRRIADPNRALPRFLLFDFKQVTGLDTTAMLSFTKMSQIAEANGIGLVFSNLSEEARLQFKIGGFEDAGAGSVRFISDTDYALEWCEDQLLASVPLATDVTGVTIEDYLKALIADSAAVTILIRYLEPQELEAGQCLIKQGDAPDDLYFIESGQVSALLETPGQDQIRLETMRGGQVLGEIGFYLDVDRTASVIADKPSKLYRLTKTQLERMEEENPEAVLALQQSIIKLLAERVARLTETVNALQR
jgi:SulP family sulfate permease